MRLEASSTGKPRMSEDPEVKEKELVKTVPKPKTDRPPLFKVVLLNDDFTPMDFVVYVLEHLFHHQHEMAVRIMLDVHVRGAGICGVYTREVAETKILQVTDLARTHEHPLRCIMERE